MCCLILYIGISFTYTIYIVISTCFFYCSFLLFLIVVTITLIFRLCTDNILNTLVMYNSSWLANRACLIFSSSVLFFLPFPSLSFLSYLPLYLLLKFFFFLLFFVLHALFFFVYLVYVIRLCGFLFTQGLTLQVFSSRKFYKLLPIFNM